MLAGHRPRGWWQARELGKDYYGSLGDLVRERRRSARSEETEAEEAQA